MKRSLFHIISGCLWCVCLLALTHQGLMAQEPVKKPKGLEVNIPGKAPSTQAPTPTPAFTPGNYPEEADTVDNNRLKILNSDLLTFRKTTSVAVQKLIGNVALRQDTTYFYCDSAYYYEADNRLIAFGKVLIRMKDSLNLRARKLTYDGNTRIAEVYDDIIMTDGDVVLTTDRMTYYRNEKYGYYKEGGKLIDGDNVLTSELGYYYSQEKKAYFKDSVELKSPDYNLYTDTLEYSTEEKLATFITFTEIESKDGWIETTSGNYQTDIKRVNLFERSVLQDSSYSMSADTLFYDDEENMGYAMGKVVVLEEDSSMEIRGRYGEFNRETEENFITDDPVAIQWMDDDTLYIFADTLYTTREDLSAKSASTGTPDSLALNSLAAGVDSLLADTLMNDSLEVRADSLAQTTIPDSTKALQVDSIVTQGQDSLAEPVSQQADSAVQDSGIQHIAIKDSAQVALPLSSLSGATDLEMTVGEAAASPTSGAEEKGAGEKGQRLFKAFKNVRIYMNEMQGRADSMVYYYEDSMMELFQDPVLWSGENQLSGERMRVYLKNGKLDSMWIGNSAFVASEEDTVGFNQIKGKEMRAKFVDNELRRLHIIGSCESIYFIQNDEDTVNVTYEGMNQALSQEMIMFFAEKDLQKILFLQQPTGTYSPYYAIMFEDNQLTGMSWRIEEKPEKPNLEGGPPQEQKKRKSKRGTPPKDPTAPTEPQAPAMIQE